MEHHRPENGISVHQALLIAYQHHIRTYAMQDQPPYLESTPRALYPLGHAAFIPLHCSLP